MTGTIHTQQREKGFYSVLDEVGTRHLLSSSTELFPKYLLHPRQCGSGTTFTWFLIYSCKHCWQNSWFRLMIYLSPGGKWYRLNQNSGVSDSKAHTLPATQ